MLYDTRVAAENSEKRFAFGKNWARFLRELDEGRILSAEASLKGMLGPGALKDRRFLDIGCGSGLSSLAARRLGARVHSFDYDLESAACAEALKARYFPGDPLWTIERGSALDGAYLAGLGRFDVVNSWGVLHHTGEMWRALDLAAGRVEERGLLFISLYNDQGWKSRAWRRVKLCYNVLPSALRFLVLLPAFVWLSAPDVVFDFLKLQPFATWRKYRSNRGMSVWRDAVDWVGGYPFEVAKPEQVLDFCRQRGFELLRLRTAMGGLGCNEFVFEKKPA